jgi:uncharacterized protein (TIGR02145 family)
MAGDGALFSKPAGASIRCLSNSQPPSTTPTLSTQNASMIEQTTASSGGYVNSDGGMAVTARGVCWNTSGNPTISNSKSFNGTGIGYFESLISGLAPNTKYYFRAYATNNIGTTYGNEKTFTTKPITVPVLTTTVTSNVTTNSATSGGNISFDGGATVISRGVCWSTTVNPTVLDSKTSDGTGVLSYSSSLVNLSANTTYHIRAYATNSAGTGYGNSIILKTYAGNITDIDGNVYYTVIIGTQTWMAENLKTTKLNDGTPIPLVTNDATWTTLDKPAYCWYNNDETANKATYGALYNLYTIRTGKVCPTGWHVSTSEDWYTLTYDYLGLTFDAAGKLMEAGTSHWASPNTGATNETGFTALPGGARASFHWPYDGNYYSIGRAGDWWSPGSGDPYTDKGYSLTDGLNPIHWYNYDAKDGLSIRCVKN